MFDKETLDKLEKENKPVTITDKVMIPITATITKNAVTQVNAQRVAAGLERLPESGKKVVVVINFAKQFANQKKISDKISVDLFRVISAGLSYDSSIKAPALALFSTGNPTQEQLNAAGQDGLDNKGQKTFKVAISPVFLKQLSEAGIPVFNENGEVNEVEVKKMQNGLYKTHPVEKYPNYSLMAIVKKSLSEQDYKNWRGKQSPEMIKKAQDELKQFTMDMGV